MSVKGYEDYQEIKYYGYNTIDAEAYIFINSEKKYIKLSEKDLKRMLDWIKYDKNLKEEKLNQC